MNISDQIKCALVEFYGFKKDAIEFIKYSQNYVYRVVYNGNHLIVRVTESSHRTKQAILSEIKWIEFLKNRGMNVCAAVSLNGYDVCEEMPCNDAIFYTVLFEQASGHPVGCADLMPTLFEQHGRLLGQLHRLTRDYKPCEGFMRPKWYESRLYTRDVDEYILSEQPRVAEVLQSLLKKGKSMSEKQDLFGLVHLDIHYNNLFLGSSGPCLFDFDNCCYGYFSNDIAKALHVSVFTYHRRRQPFDDTPFESPWVDEALAAVWPFFWKGYRSEREPVPELFETLPLFFMLTDMKDYIHHHRHKTPERDDRIKAAFRKMQHRIERRILPVRFDFIHGTPLPDTVYV